MSGFFPQAAYAEEQRYAYTILTTHVLHRGFQAGAIACPLISLPGLFISKSPPKYPILQLLLRSAGMGSVVGTGVVGVMLLARMTGRSQIEWADRSWRLLGNKWQVEVDDFSLIGTIIGTAAAGMVLSGPKMTRLGWRGVVGGGAVGNLVGVGTYMVWRHGIKRGEFDR